MLRTKVFAHWLGWFSLLVACINFSTRWDPLESQTHSLFWERSLVTLDPSGINLPPTAGEPVRRLLQTSMSLPRALLSPQILSRPPLQPKKKADPGLRLKLPIDWTVAVFHSGIVRQVPPRIRHRLLESSFVSLAWKLGTSVTLLEKCTLPRNRVRGQCGKAPYMPRSPCTGSSDRPRRSEKSDVRAGNHAFPSPRHSFLLAPRSNACHISRGDEILKMSRAKMHQMVTLLPPDTSTTFLARSSYL